MAWRFPDVLPVSGDILHTSHWNNNIDAFSSELNGFLDRDNIKTDSIKKGMVKHNAFVKVFFSAHADTKGPNENVPNDFDIPMRTTAWSSVDTSTDGDEMPGVSFEADTDGWVECDFHASYQWTEPADPSGGSQAWFKYDDDSDVFYASSSGDITPKKHTAIGAGARTPDGVEEDWKDEFQQEWSTNATDPVWSKSGPYWYASADGVAVKAYHFNGGLIESPNDKDSVAFRVLVDGIVVAETGWLSIGLYRNGVYLTGVAPISAGKHTIKTEVRAARVEKMFATSGALADAGSLTVVEPVSMTAARVPGTGSRCSVRARALTVIYRKR